MNSSDLKNRTAQAEAAVEHFVRESGNQPDQMLPLLHAVQARCRYVPRQIYAAVAAALNVSVAGVAGVVSFYSNFRDSGFSDSTETPDQASRAKPHIEVCCAEACQANAGARYPATLP